MEEVVVLIVGAGPSGLATSACLNKLSIPNLILEKEHCHASLWKLHAYDRLKLHLAKEFCHLPHKPFPPTAPTYIPKDDFVQYVDNYVSEFHIQPRFHRLVESASYDKVARKWRVEARNGKSGEAEVYVSEFLVVATGENAEGFVPWIPGIESFAGDAFHSRAYKSGKEFRGKDVLVVGSGNSGMEIAFDLCESGARTSIVIRSPVHVLTTAMVRLEMTLIKYIPISIVDGFITLIARLWFGNLTKYGVSRPAEGPFFQKLTQGRAPVIDVGTISKIKKGDIKVLPELKSIEGSNFKFSNGETRKFDVVVFATGYKSAANKWLKDYDYLLNKEGMPKNEFPNHWKGLNGLYCAGLARRGLAGVSMDSQAIAEDIKLALAGSKKEH